MTTPIDVLILADRPDDAALMVRELRRHGFAPEWRRVQSEAAFLDALDNPPDVILADHTPPRSGALRALQRVEERGLHVPVIVVSGTIGEETAVEYMKRGATDYLLKDRLARLGPAVERAVEKAHLRENKDQVLEQLRESEARFRRLAENLPDIIYRYRLEPFFVVEYLNAAVTQVTGYTPDAFYADPMLGIQIVHPDDRPRLKALLAEDVPDGHLTLRWYHKDGSLLWIEQRSAPVYDETGTVVAVEGSARDVTARKRAKAKLQFQANILRNVRDSVIVTDTGGAIQYWNAGARELFGYTADEMLGERPARLYPDMDPDRLASDLREILETGAYVGEWLGRRKDGSQIWVDIKTTPMYSADGTLVGFIGVSKDITARVRQKQELQETKQLLQTTLDNLGDAVFVVAPEQRTILLCNAAVERVFGYAPDELIGRSTEILHVDRESYERFGQIGEQILDRGGVIHIEYKMQHKDGTLIHTENTVTGIDSESGWVSGVVSMVRDITERKQAEVHMRELNERLQAVIQSSPAAIIALDVEDNVTLWSPAAEAIFGWKQEEVLGKPYPIVPDDGYEQSEANRRQILAGNTVAGLELRRQHKDGTLIDVSLSSAPLRDSDGEIIGIMTLLQDITERKRAERRMHEVNERLTAVIQASPIAIIVLDTEGHVMLWSPAAEEMFGWRREKVLGRAPPIVPEDDYDTFVANRDHVLRGNSHTDIELRRQRKDGSMIDVSMATAPLRDADGDVIGIMALLHDITERKQAEAALKRQTRRLEIVHQIDTAILNADAPREIAQVALDQIRQLLRCWRASLAVYSDEEQQPVLLAVSVDGDTEISVGAKTSADPVWDMSSLRRGEIHVEENVTATEEHSPVLRRLIQEGLRSYASIPLRVHGDLLGTLNLAFDTSDVLDSEDLDIAREVADRLAIAIHQARLHEQLQALAGYLQDAREEERARLARNIHDDLGQALTAIKYDLSRLQRRLPDDLPELHEEAKELLTYVDSTIRTVRRVSSELRPGILDDLGLSAAIQWHVNEFSRRTGIDCTMNLRIDDNALPEKLSTALFRVCQEALTNVARHAGADHVDVGLREHADAVILTVQDNGRGISERELSDPDSLGLRGMRERVRPWDGYLSVEGSPGAGTTVAAHIPIGDMGVH